MQKLLESQNNPDEQPGVAVDRRRLIRRGVMFGAGTALAALAIPEGAKAQDDPNDPAGLWGSVVSAADNSFPPFRVFGLWGDGTFIGSGQTDLTPAVLESSAWGRWTKVGPRMFRLIARFWTYDPTANPTGFGAVDFTYTISADGTHYHGVGPLQFFDNNNNPVAPATKTFDDGVRIA